MVEEIDPAIDEEFTNALIENPPETQDGVDMIKFLAEEEQAEIVKLAAENYNLAQDMDEEQKSRIAKIIWQGFEADDQSRAEWLEMHTFWLSLYMQNDYAETSDTERSWGATESLPILSEACDQFQGRTYKAFFPQEEFVSAVSLNFSKKDKKENDERAKRVGRHMSYQLGIGNRKYKSDKDALFLGVALHGSFFTKTYYSDELKGPKVDNVRPTDLVINYNVGPIDIKDVRRKTHIIYTTVGETEISAQSGYLIDKASPSKQEGENAYNVKVDETAGLQNSEASVIKSDANAVLLEQHFYLDLDGNGEYRPYIGTICAADKKLKRFIIGYEANPDGTPIDDYKQVQYFTHYKFKNNPDGFYGLGLGHSIGDLNSAINIMLRQSMDAATLANDGNTSGFISERLGIESDEIAMVLGKFRKIPDTAGDIQSGIFQFNFPGPNAALLNLMDTLDARAQRLGSTTEATTGTSEKVLQPTTMLSQIEQALEAFSASQQRLANALGEELEKIFKINQKYLPLVTYYVVNNEIGTVTRNDYKNDMIIAPIFDPKLATRAQRIAKAEAELKGTLENPLNQGRPHVIDTAFRRYFEALEVTNIDELIPSADPDNIDDQHTENMYFLMPNGQGMSFDVFPDQNHAQHLMILQEFLENNIQEIPPENIPLIMAHMQKHKAYLYGQLNGVEEAGGPVGNIPLAAGSNNAGNPQGFIPQIPNAQPFNPAPQF